MSRRAAEERLQRLLVMLPWLMEHERVPIAEVADRFDLTIDEVYGDLELVSMCGLPPFVDELIDLFIDDDIVHIGVPRLFTRSLRLTSVEALELVLAVEAAQQLPGADPTGPLARAVGKLADVVQLDGALALDLQRPAEAELLSEAARRGQVMMIEYWTPARDEVSTRRLVPRQVFTDRGNWYTTALAVVDNDDEEPVTDTQSARTFRIDRIVSITPTGSFVELDEVDLPVPGEWFDDPELERAVLILQGPARWVVERYPTDEIESLPDGSLRVVLPVSKPGWLARLLVRLGPDARVEEPEHLRSVGRQAAAEILARYRRV
jgi:proteasome accessory factor C